MSHKSLYLFFGVKLNLKLFLFFLIGLFGLVIFLFLLACYYFSVFVLEKYLNIKKTWFY